jgi:hypothetical protein
MGERKRSQKISQPPEKKTVGDFLCWLEFTETEQERIASLINSDGLPKQILTKYGPKTYSYSEFRKKESIPGFRGGHEAYNRLAIPKIIEGLQTPSFRNYKFCWRIYREAATKFVIGELEELNRLLENIPYQGEERDAAGMLTLICSNASEFHAKPDAIKTLYEIWWIDRVENFEELLKLSDSYQRRLQNKVERQAILRKKSNKSVTG